MAIITPRQLPQISSYSHHSQAGTTDTQGRIGQGLDWSTQSSAQLGQDGVSFSAEAFRGSDASFSASSSSGAPGFDSGRLSATARLGNFASGSLEGATQLGILKHSSLTNFNGASGLLTKVDSNFETTPDSAKALVAIDVLAGTRGEIDSKNSFALPGGTEAKLNSTLDGYAGAFATARLSSEYGPDKVLFEGAYKYAAGAGGALKDTVGLSKSNGSGLDLSYEVGGSAGVSGEAAVKLGREGQVTTLGGFVAAEIGPGGGIGGELRLHDDDAVSLTSGALRAASLLSADPLSRQTAATLDKFVTGDLQGLASDPNAAAFGAGITRVGAAVDQGTARVADAGASLRSFSSDAEAGAFAHLDENSSRLDVTMAGVTHAAARVLRFFGGATEATGTVAHRAGGGRIR